MTPAGPISISSEGFFDGSYQAAGLVVGTSFKTVNCRCISFYDIFFHPDILYAKLTGDTKYVASVSQGLSLEKSLKEPASLSRHGFPRPSLTLAPNVSVFLTPSKVKAAE
jgi:hypothetical protein